MKIKPGTILSTREIHLNPQRIYTFQGQSQDKKFKSGTTFSLKYHHLVMEKLEFYQKKKILAFVILNPAENTLTIWHEIQKKSQKLSPKKTTAKKQHNTDFKSASQKQYRGRFYEV